jgi:hypothetical protein
MPWMKGVAKKPKQNIYYSVKVGETIKENGVIVEHHESRYVRDDDPQELKDKVARMVGPYWYYARNPEIMKKVHNNDVETDMGKWMLFYPKSQMEAAWKLAQDKYNAHELEGIICMKCSTNRPNPRASNKDTGVIILYCSGNKNNILKYGHNIIKKIPYSVNPPDNYIFYKTDNMTFRGTRATGQKKNYLYKIYNKEQPSDKWLGGDDDY